MLPKMVEHIKAGHKIYPSLTELSRMTEHELSLVENFSIESKYLKIQFIPPVDLRDLDLDAII